jgi:hypothetical protein
MHIRIISFDLVTTLEKRLGRCLRLCMGIGGEGERNDDMLRGSGVDGAAGEKEAFLEKFLCVVLCFGFLVWAIAARLHAAMTNK